jgi:hypothetical protein
MRNSICKVLRESISNKPDWVDKFNNFSRDERIDFIEKYKQQVEKLLPKIIIYFKAKYLGEGLRYIKVDERRKTYEEERYKGSIIVLTFNFKGRPYWEFLSLMNEIGNDLHYFFNVDVGYDYIPLRLEYDTRADEND